MHDGKKYHIVTMCTVNFWYVGRCVGSMLVMLMLQNIWQLCTSLHCIVECL